jgi:hypothetical protein
MSTLDSFGRDLTGENESARMKPAATDLHVGIDFDNTIIGYDEVFCAEAKRSGLIGQDFVGTKQTVRDAIRLLPDGELAWQRLQGQVYGNGIGGAVIIPGVEAFLRRCRAEGCTVSVVSHKTEFGHYDPDRVNLRKAALNWMAANGLVGDAHAIPAANIYFESTRAEKLWRIGLLALTHFIDDLEEVLTDPGFPPRIKRILFGSSEPPAAAPYAVCPTWQDVEHRIFGGEEN